MRPPDQQWRSAALGGAAEDQTGARLLLLRIAALEAELATASAATLSALATMGTQRTISEAALAGAERALETAREEIRDKQEHLEAREAQLREQEAVLAETGSRLNATQERLHAVGAQLVTARRQLADVERRLVAAEALLAESDRRLALLHASTSWRIMAPFRSMAARLPLVRAAVRRGSRLMGTVLRRGP